MLLQLQPTKPAEEEQAGKFHFLQGLGSADPSLNEAVTEVFFGIVSTLLARESRHRQRQLQQQPSPALPAPSPAALAASLSLVGDAGKAAVPAVPAQVSRLRLHVLDFCALQFAPEDVAQLHKIGIVSFVGACAANEASV